MPKPFPELTSDSVAEDFVATARLQDYDLSRMRRTQFEFASKSAQLNMRLPADLLQAVKDRAGQVGIPYTRFVRQLLETAVSGDR